MLLEVEDLTVHYGNVNAVRGINLSVERNEIVALIGANGAGKTSTLGAISGVRPKSGGRVRFEATDISDVPAHRMVGLGVSHVPEGRGIFPGMSVIENLQMGAYSRHHAKRSDLEADYARVHELFPLLAERSGQAAGTLSGGEQQMLAIGRALMTRPKLLLLDEPSMGLAPMKVQQIFEIMMTIREQGTTILVVEQNAAQILQRADRAYVIENGTVVRSGVARELREDPAIRAAYLGGDTGRGLHPGS